LTTSSCKSPGQLVALVGASGSGKTTLANLLLRFYDPTRGAIRIGGVDIRDVTTRDLRNQIAVVTQETILFNDTVRRNIELGRPGATNDEIIAAARTPTPTISSWKSPNGFDTFIGEKGVTLSGGQRQRLAIARAVLKNAPILVLDEATSALDTESERAVQAALDELMKGRTTICIAHRLSTILHADDDCGAGSGPHRGNRHARGTGPARRHLPKTLRTAIRLVSARPEKILALQFKYFGDAVLMTPGAAGNSQTFPNSRTARARAGGNRADLPAFAVAQPRLADAAPARKREARAKPGRSSAHCAANALTARWISPATTAARF
jgi:ABC-type lipoprotein export system ATPase subunit